MRLMLPVLMVALAVGCAAADEPTDDAENVESAAGVLTVYGAASKSCSTSIVRGLAEQLVAEMACLEPDALSKLDLPSNVELAPEVFPYLQPPAAEALTSAATAYGKPMKINSALRTLPQQYLLRTWDLQNRCGVPLAARVGYSNHESGASLDIALGTPDVNKAVRGAMKDAGFRWHGPDDPVHFDFDRADAGLSGTSVLAFKRLWNRNHPEAILRLDDTYDARVEAKLKSSPAAGFARGAKCDEPPADET